MIRNNNEEHILTTVCSLNKSMLNAKLKGKLNSSNIYILNIIYNLLNKCNISEEDNMKLSLLYNKVFYESLDICKTYNIDSSLHKSTPIYTQNNSSVGNTPTFDYIEYWQENSITNTINDIIPEIDNRVKQFDSYQSFNNGKTITYSNIGRLCFLLNNESSTNYSIYDELNNNVTSLFDIQYILNRNDVIIVSKNIYSYGDIKFKIIKNL